jgi:hypothetical protein
MTSLSKLILNLMLITKFAGALNTFSPLFFRSNSGVFSAGSTRLQSTIVEDMAENSSSSLSQKMEYPIEMTEDERYLFDLNGYIIVRGVLTPEQVKEANDAINNHSHKMIERSEDSLRNAVKETKFYGEGPGRMDLGQVLEWGKESKVFKSILAHPRLVPLFHGILGEGYRMDHLPFVLAQNKGSEGLVFYHSFQKKSSASGCSLESFSLS